MAQIVLADDEADIRSRMGAALKAAGHAVRLAADGREALELIGADLPDLVVADFMMPYMPGFELWKRLLEVPAYRELPVIMLITRCAEVDAFYEAESGLWREGVDTLTKPFEPRELVGKVEWRVRSGHLAPLVLIAGSPDQSWSRIVRPLRLAGLRVRVAGFWQPTRAWIYEQQPELVITEAITADLEAVLPDRPDLPVVTPTGALLHPANAATCGPEGTALSALVSGCLQELRP